MSRPHKPKSGRESSHHENHETTPLLTRPEDKPLPMGQMYLLCFARMVEPWAFFSIFPFISQMVFETGIPQSQTGFYTGLIESCFCLVQFCVMPFWGRMSDSRGRKPLLIYSLFGLVITSVLFGFAKNVYWMIFFRCLSGIFSGSAVSIRTMISEISTPKTQAKAFSLFAFSGTVSIFFAPLAGGLLVKPAENFRLFRNFQLFITYPYLLPCLLTGLISLAAALTNLFFLEETLKKVDKLGEPTDSAPAPTVTEIFKAPGVLIVCIIYAWTFILGFANMAILPVFQFTPIHLGGFGFSPKQISIYLSIAGVSQAFWNLFVYTSLHRKIGSKGILRWSARAWLIAIASFVALQYGLRHQLSQKVFWVANMALAFFTAAISLNYNAATLALNDISPEPAALGTITGVSLSIGAAIKALIPAVSTSVFATGFDKQILWGQFGWLVMFILAIGFMIIIEFLPRKSWGLESEQTQERLDEEIMAGVSSISVVA